MYKSIAIDGPSGSGKSTISKKLAKRINFNYLDTGAMYRTCTYYYLKNNIDINNENLINKHIENINIEIKDDKYFLNGEDVTKIIRGNEVTNNVSKVSSYRKVRENLVNMQREIAKKSNIILDGRDIGTHVLKDANIKFYLTADEIVRAKRRLNDKNSELNQKDLDDILEDIKRRDELDSNREITPLSKACDAILIDSSDKSIEEVLDIIVNLLEKENVI